MRCGHRPKANRSRCGQSARRERTVVDTRQPRPIGRFSASVDRLQADVEPRGSIPLPTIAATEVSVLHIQRRRVST